MSVNTFSDASNRLERLNESGLTWTIGLLSLTGFVFSFVAVSIGFHYTLFDFHGFRQAQTAITAEYLLRGGSFLHYETPVLGPPWALPFEFPLYQWIVAFLALHFSMPLEETGRAVSISFFYLSFFPLASILRLVGFQRMQIVVILALVAASPIYIFISRLFMIESTVLLLSLIYLEQILRFTLGKYPWRYRNVALSGICGVLAGLVKVTTFAPYFLLGVGLIAYSFWKIRKKERPKALQLIAAFVFPGFLPVMFTVLWTRFADGEKAKNPVGVFLTSKALSAWNYGTLAQRLDFANYKLLLHQSSNHVGSFVVAAITVAAYFWTCRKPRLDAILCVSLYILTPMIFFNLHIVHEYYSYASAIFLVVSIGMLIASMLALQNQKAWVGAVMFTALLIACFTRYRQHFYPIQSRNAVGRPNAALIVDQSTKDDSVVLLLGLQWSSAFPYEIHRRAIMYPGIEMAPGIEPTRLPENPDPMKKAIENQGAASISAVVACDSERGGTELKKLLRLTYIRDVSVLHADNCDIYNRRDDHSFLNGSSLLNSF